MAVPQDAQYICLFTSPTPYDMTNCRVRQGYNRRAWNSGFSLVVCWKKEVTTTRLKPELHALLWLSSSFRGRLLSLWLELDHNAPEWLVPPFFPRVDHSGIESAAVSPSVVEALPLSPHPLPIPSSV